VKVPAGQGKSSARAPVIAYATNCYSGDSCEELMRALRTEVSAVRDHLGGEESVGVSLRVSARQAREIAGEPGLVEDLRAALDDAGATVVGANAFPISAPRDDVYKDGIYRPDWREEERLGTTLEIARAVAALTAEGQPSVITTLTGTFRLWPGAESVEVEEACVRNLQACAQEFERISAETGRELYLALEPEPYTTAETAFEAVAYFQEGLFAGPGGGVARRRLGLNLDLSHLAVMFEDPAECLGTYREAGIPVLGLHVSAALSLGDPAGQVERLRAFDEPKYLHQVTAVDEERNVAFRSAELGEFLALPARELEHLAEARVHFHVPVFADEVGGLRTTSAVTWDGVRAAVAGGDTGLFVVETYTWPQLQGRAGADESVAAGIAREFRKTFEVLEG
jgi:hypothetical protein